MLSTVSSRISALPQRAEDVGFGQTEEEIAEDLWMKDVGVQEGAIKRDLALVEQPDDERPGDVEQVRCQVAQQNARMHYSMIIPRSKPCPPVNA